VAEVWGADRVGYHLSPRADILGMGDDDPVATFSYLVDRLSQRDLAFVISRDPEGAGTLAPLLRPRFGGAWIANGGFTPERAVAVVEAGGADAVAFGQLSIPNPDLPERVRQGLPLARPQPATFYNEHRFLFDGELMPTEGFHPSDRRGYLDFDAA
jgi:2,4-dienoyl-CoA reductase-like NADH-dependent reductase (Old Yellow Enzyme family)